MTWANTIFRDPGPAIPVKRNALDAFLDAGDVGPPKRLCVPLTPPAATNSRHVERPPNNKKTKAKKQVAKLLANNPPATVAPSLLANPPAPSLLTTLIRAQQTAKLANTTPAIAGPSVPTIVVGAKTGPKTKVVIDLTRGKAVEQVCTLGGIPIIMARAAGWIRD